MILDTVKALIAYLKLPELESPNRAYLECSGELREDHNICLPLQGRDPRTSITVRGRSQLVVSRTVARGAARILFEDRVYECIQSDFVEIHKWHRLQLTELCHTRHFFVAHRVSTYLHSKHPDLFAPAGTQVQSRSQAAKESPELIQSHLASGRPASIVPFFAHKDLCHYIETFGEPDRECKVAWIRQIQKMHSCLQDYQIFHRDIKLENFLVTEDLNLLLTDMETTEGYGPDAEAAGAAALSQKICGTDAYRYRPHCRWLRKIDPDDVTELAAHHLAADSMACLFVVLEILNSPNWHQINLPEPLSQRTITKITNNLEARGYEADVRDFVAELFGYSQYPINSGEVDAPFTKKIKVAAISVTDPESGDASRSQSQNTTL